MKSKVSIDRRGRPALSHPLFLLLAVMAGAFAGRFRALAAVELPLLHGSFPWLLAVPVLLGGNVFGLYGIPAAALLFGFGAETMLEPLSAAGSVPPIRQLLPLLLLTPGFFLTATAGMKLSEDCLDAALAGGDESFRSLLGRQIVICLAAAAFLLLYFHFY